MRRYNHRLSESKSGKSAILEIKINDRFGNKTFQYVSVKGWRKDLALKHLQFESQEWDYNMTKTFVGLQILKCSKNRLEGTTFINILKSLNQHEVLFWCYKFLVDFKTQRAWRSFYGISLNRKG